MFTGPMLDRRAHATLLCRLLADRAEDEHVSMHDLAETAREVATMLLASVETDQVDGRPALRVIEGGRR